MKKITKQQVQSIYKISKDLEVAINRMCLLEEKRREALAEITDDPDERYLILNAFAETITLVNANLITETEGNKRIKKMLKGFEFQIVE